MKAKREKKEWVGEKGNMRKKAERRINCTAQVRGEEKEIK